MDERIKKAIDLSSYRISLFNKKESIKSKVDTMLLHAINGGVFTISTDLISFVKTLLDLGKDRMVLIDNNGNPIEIFNPESFFQDIVDKYFQATNYYHNDYTKLKKARSVADQFKDLFEEEKK